MRMAVAKAVGAVEVGETQEAEGVVEEKVL